MTKFKKLVSFVLAGAMTLAMSVSAFAATGVTETEQKILNEAKAKAVELGVNVNTSQRYKDYYAQAETYLVKNDLTDKQVDALVAAVDEAAATAKKEMSSNGVSKLGDLSSSVFAALESKVSSQITKAAEAVGIHVTKTANGWEVQDVNGNTVAQNTTGTNGSNATIKQTGAELTTTVVMAVMFVGALSACVVVAKKRNLFANAEA